MDPVTLAAVAALLSGAATGLTATVTQPLLDRLGRLLASGGDVVESVTPAQVVEHMDAAGDGSDERREWDRWLADVAAVLGPSVSGQNVVTGTVNGTVVQAHTIDNLRM